MLFNSLQYALFLPVVVVTHWVIPERFRLPWIVVASYVFYAAWDWRFLLLLWLSTAVDFVVARLIEGSDQDRRRRRLLTLSICIQLGILGCFKYFDFFIGSAADLMDSVGFEASEPALRVILPVGVSFYTFQTMAYTIDVYRRRIPACRDLVLFATFVSFFPQLVAGPIERAAHMFPQYQRRRHRPTGQRLESAVLLIFLGLVKKVVIGDSMAAIVDEAFGRPGSLGSIGVAVGVVAFAIQIYADFSAYTDIARGSARLFDIELMHNFRQPYLSRQISEFWRRWHIALSTWLRDYLYVPLGGNRRGSTRTYVNLMATMLLGGLWHGASWTFVIWGGLHGVYLVVHRAFRPDSSVTDELPHRFRAVMSVAGTFVLVCLAWVFFRADSVVDALEVLGGMARLDGGAMPTEWALVPVSVALVLAIDVATRLRGLRGWRPERSPVFVGAALGLAVVSLVVFSGGEPVPFVYFQF